MNGYLNIQHIYKYRKMFRAKTVKRGAKKTSSVSGPITPSSNPIAATVSTVSTVSTVDVSGSVFVEVPVVKDPVAKQELTTESMLLALLDAESKNAVHRPWLRLERGIRMRLLRSYVDKKTELTQAERVDLLATLVDALDKKLLNSKSQISYNEKSGEIIEIHSLKITKGVGGKTIYRIEPPNRNTKKAKRHTAGSDSD
jgi:hypothetical protein